MLGLIHIVIFCFCFINGVLSWTQQQHHSIPLNLEGLADSDSSDADHTGQKIPKLALQDFSCQIKICYKEKF